MPEIHSAMMLPAASVASLGSPALPASILMGSFQPLRAP
jgi:hypothetical protein